MEEEDLPDEVIRLSWSVKQVNGTGLLVKGEFCIPGRGYDVLVYDKRDILFQSLSVEDFSRQCKVHNPSVEASSSYLLEQVKSCFYESRHGRHPAIYESTDDGATLACKTRIEGDIPFIWRFQLRKASSELVEKLLISPLTAMVSEYDRWERALFDLLEKKDAEINDYKSQGVSVSRKALETPLFDSSEFLSQRLQDLKEEKRRNYRPANFSCFDATNCKQLFQTLMSVIVSKREFVSPQKHAVVETQEATLAATLLLPDDLDAEETSVAVEPCKDVPSLAAMKRSHGAADEEKIDAELRRRNELQEKLAKKATTKAKQNKKFKL